MTTKQPPFFLADPSISHPAEDFRRLLSALTSDTEGIILATDLAVTQRGAGANMSVDVAGGRAWMLGDSATYQGTYFGENRGVQNVTIAAADATNPRRDIIVARVRDAGYTGSSNDWDIIVVTGTAAAVPVDPTLPVNAISLARVAVAALASSITNANITDLRTKSRGSWNSAWGEVSKTTSTSTSTFTSTADLMTATWTAVANRRYKLSAYATGVAGSAPSNITMTITDNTPTTLQTNAQGTFAVGGLWVASAFVEVSPAGGSVTYRVRVGVAGGNVALSGSATSPHYLLVEDMGP